MQSRCYKEKDPPGQNAPQGQIHHRHEEREAVKAKQTLGTPSVLQGVQVSFILHAGACLKPSLLLSAWAAWLWRPSFLSSTVSPSRINTLLQWYESISYHVTTFCFPMKGSKKHSLLLLRSYFWMWIIKTDHKNTQSVPQVHTHMSAAWQQTRRSRFGFGKSHYGLSQSSKWTHLGEDQTDWTRDQHSNKSLSRLRGDADERRADRSTDGAPWLMLQDRTGVVKGRK